MKMFEIIGQVVVQTGSRKRTYAEVMCKKCKLKSTMSPSNAKKSKRFFHDCEPRTVNKWLTIAWV